MSKPGRRLKVSPNLRVFVSRVVRNGQVQRAFTEQIGHPVGGCVAGRVRTGMSGGQVHDAARECAKQVRGTRLNLAGAPRARAPAARATEYYEVSPDSFYEIE